ncbi:hypothetical protein DB346_13090 [Verrucomicrobia bacterium LW23]|nr:hypothetical protein DB346_13090 [Verrucomicrobia bacterium LW23]
MNAHRSPHVSHPWCAFTLPEVLTAVAVSAAVLVLLATFVGRSMNVLNSATARSETRQGTAAAADCLERDLARAMLESYSAADPTGASGSPALRSSMRFLVATPGADGLPGLTGTGHLLLFQAVPDGSPASAASAPPVVDGVDPAVATYAFYVAFARAPAAPTHASAEANPLRFRLMRVVIPPDLVSAYPPSDADSWLSASEMPRYTTAVADNVIALIVRPVEAGGTPETAPRDVTAAYLFDSLEGAEADPQSPTAHRLPPMLQITVVAIDEAAARRLDRGAETPPVEVTSALAGKFLNPAERDADIADMRRRLHGSGIHLTVRTLSIPLRESTWPR